MPLSKRNKVVATSSTRKKGRAGKTNLIEEIRECLDQFKFVYVFELKNSRNKLLKEVRTRWEPSKFFFGKNKVIQLALGRSAQDEQKPNLHEIAERVSGLCGLFMTNDPKEVVLDFFNKYVEKDFARGGLVSTEDITLPEGPLTQFAHSMEGYLRTNLGMPTELKQGVILLRQPFKVAVKGQPLTPEQARLLKLLEIKMAEFKFDMLAVWHNGEVEDLAPDHVPAGGDGDAMDDSDDE